MSTYKFCEDEMSKEEIEELKRESFMKDEKYGVYYVPGVDETILFKIIKFDNKYNKMKNYYAKGLFSRHGNYRERRSVLHKFTWWFGLKNETELEVIKWFVFDVWGYPRDAIHEFSSESEFKSKYIERGFLEECGEMGEQGSEKTEDCDEEQEGDCVYTAAKSKRVAYWCNGYAPDDPDFMEETLYKTFTGKYFLYEKGGENTIYHDIFFKEGGEGIHKVSPDLIRLWFKRHHQDVVIYNEAYRKFAVK